MRFIKSFCLIMLIMPLYTYSLTSGPTQPEFTSFEPVDVTDLVNLPTGDFTYVLPLGEVKGPAGVGYPVALSYHAGIMNEQEASWVGLGWTLNAGAITRMVRGSADDACNDPIYSYMYLKGEEGWSFNLGAGWGPVGGSIGFSNKGFQGITSISVGYGFGPFSLGMSVSKDLITMGVGFGTPGQIGIGGGVGLQINTSALDIKPYAYVGLSANGISVASFSISSKNQMNVSVAGGSFNAAQHNEGGINSWSSGFGLTLPLPYGYRIDFGYSSYGWNFEQLVKGKVFGYLYHSLKNGRQVDTYNKILQKYPAPSGEYVEGVEPLLTAQSIIENVPKLEYIKGNTDIVLPAQDIYNVTGQGISGTFKPFAYKAIKVGTTEDEYDGAFGEIANDTIRTPFNDHPEKFGFNYKDGIVFRMLGEASMNLIDDVKGYINDSSECKNIDNLEDGAGRTYGTRIEPIFGSDAGPKEKLSGFIITDMEGKSYYYTLPLFTWGQVTYTSKDQVIPANGQFLLDKGTNYSYRYETTPYAITWLLTAITGPDYIKTTFDTTWAIWEEKIRPHQGDYGYWVSFRYEYGREITNTTGLPECKIMTDSDREKEDVSDFIRHKKANYLWRDPYNGFKSKPGSSDSKYSAQLGYKEITYLKSIETSSEIAYFRTSSRYDGVGPSTSSYPTAKEYNFGEDQVEGEITTAPDPGFYAEVVPRKPGQYLKVKIPKSEFNNNWEIGDELCRLNISVDRHGKSLLRKVTVKANNINEVIVLYDNTGWKFDSTGKPITPTQEQMINACSMGDLVSRKFFTADNKFTGYNNGMKYAKCFYIGEENDSNVLFITSYYITQYDVNAQTHFVVTWDPIIFGDFWAVFFLKRVDNVRISGGRLNRYDNSTFSSNIITRYQKKLDEVAWYSKAEYPYLNPKFDPGEEGAEETFPWKDSLPYPQSYRRAKLRYNYELAKNTPNSYNIDNKTIGNGGRLTLKEVRMEAGLEEKSISMPPYLFTYQNADTLYQSYENADKWGYRLTEDQKANGDVYFNDTVGVDWNLSEILLPSCSKISVSYKRDKVFGVEGALHRIRDLDDQGDGLSDRSYDWKNYDFIKWDKKNKTHYYTGGLAPKYDPDWGIEAPVEYNSNEGYPIVKCSEKPQKGDYFYALAYFVNERDAGLGNIETEYHRHLRSLYCIEDVVDQGEDKYLLKGDFGFLFWKCIDIGCDKCKGNSVVLYILRPRRIYGDGIRVNKINCSSISVKNTIEYTYPDGDIEVLPENAVPWQIFSKTYKYTVDKHSNGNIESWVCGRKGKVSMVNDGYNGGNTTVIYPSVNVSQTDESLNRKYGFTKYHFYTTKDIINGQKIIDQESDYHGNTKVVDRSAIVGQIKGIEYFNSDSVLIKVNQLQYTFGDCLGNIYYNSIDSTINGAEKPIGLVRERVIKMGKDSDDSMYHVKGITTISYFLPFQTKITEKDYRTKSEKIFGLFNALTGKAMAVSDKKKVEFSIPNYLISDEDMKRKIVEKNAIELPGLSGTIGTSFIPERLINLLSLQYNEIDKNDKILKADATKYILQEFNFYNEKIPSNQYRINLHIKYAWKGRNKNENFKWFQHDSTKQWQRITKIDSIDAYSRQIQVTDPDDIQSVMLYHPYINGIIAIIQNAKADEVGVFTCDYDDYLNLNENKMSIEDDWLDKSNGWFKKITPGGEVKVVNDPIHFGNKTLYVKNSWGPSKKITTYKNQNYTFSAWVYRNTIEPVMLKITKMNKDSDSIGKQIAPFVFNTTLRKWEKISCTIPKDSLIDLPDSSLIEITLGKNGLVNFYVDDIRFYPSRSLIKTFYYDQQLAMPITFVDENDRALYFKYDEFGRVIEKGVLKD